MPTRNFSFNYNKNIFLAYVKSDIDNLKKLSIEVEGKKYELNHVPIPCDFHARNLDTLLRC